MYKLLIRPFLFLLGGEQAHHFTLNLFRVVLAVPGMKGLFKSLYQVEHKQLEKELFGLKFKNPIGLAAGFDKDAAHIEKMSCLGFGFIEVGTVTPEPQIGNPQPRLFRLQKDEAIINRMGFNNKGLEAMIEKLKAIPAGYIIGGNIGKNKVTPNEKAKADYIKCFNGLFEFVDYFVVNVSSPNTPGLRALQEKAPLTDLLQTLMDLNNQQKKSKPILLKIAPDLTNEQLDDIIEIVKSTGIAGVIATNTTIERKGLATKVSEIAQIGNGGLSGLPLQDRSTEVIRYLADQSGKAFPIIGVGGINSGESAVAKLRAGADLVQVYSGFVYEGPSLVKSICKAIIEDSKN